MKDPVQNIPVGTRALIFSKLYFGVLTKSLEKLEIERYFSVMYFLHENGGCSQQHICNNLAIDKTAMVKVIEYLTDAGLIEKQVNPDDRRQHFILLTRKGEKQTREIVSAFNAIEEKIFAGVPKQQKVNFMRTLDKLSERLRALPSNDLFFNYKNTKRK